MNRDFTDCCTTVPEDVRDFPVPSGRKIRDIVYSVLSGQGYNGFIDSKAYGENASDLLPPYLDEEEEDEFTHNGDKYWRLNRMLVDIGFWALENPEPRYEAANLMVVAHNIEEETEFVHLLQNLKASYYNVLLVVPDQCEPSKVPLADVNLVWHWKSLLEGGSPMSRTELRGLLDQGKRECIYIGPQSPYNTEDEDQ